MVKGGGHEPYERLDAPGEPSLKVRRRLALRSGNICAFTGCTNRLEKSAPQLGKGTILGEECHIVAKRDHPSVARAPRLLTDEEKEKWVDLIEDRHGFLNLVLMCREHAVLIDDIDQEFSVEDIVDMKLAHDNAVEASQAEMADRIDGEVRATRPAPQVRAIVLEDVGEWQRKAIRALADADSDALSWLRSEIDAADGDVQALISEWPKELVTGPPELIVAVAREAEARGLWAEATEVWRQHAERTEDLAAKADHLVRAAVNAGVHGDENLRHELLQKAEELDPTSVRLRLEQLDADLSPSDQLAYLEKLKTDDPALGSLIAAQRSLVLLLLADVEGAELAWQEAAKLESDSVAVGVAGINLEVQKARLALTGDRAFVKADILKARDDALALRRRLLDMRRFEESSRLLMMATEVMALLRDTQAAREILERAAPEEIEAPTGPEVLGDAALRIDAPELALKLTSGAEASDSIVRIRATAEAELPGPSRKVALERLRELALSDSPEKEYAAASRLLVCLPPVEAAWDDEVAVVLEDGPHHLMATKLRILTLVKVDPEKAKLLATEQPTEPWAAELRLRVAGFTEDIEMIKSAATEFLRYGPDATGLILIGKGFAKAGDFDRAGDTLVKTAHDPNSPPRLRSEAYDYLMSTLADRSEWHEARRIWNEWADFATKEWRAAFPRISAWQVRVAHNDRPRTKG